jgi:16S rRNA (cytosine967-C5)-methyltransferase
VASSARQAAFAALRKWRRGNEFADSIIATIFGQGDLTSPDRAFALDLFYGVLRNLTLLDFWIGYLRPSHVDVDLRDILRLGLYQILLIDTAEHAAVYETVELAAKNRRGIINAILRNAARRREELLAQAKTQPLSVRTSHPEFLITRWQEHFGPENTESLCTWNNQPPVLYARINRLKISREEFLRAYPQERQLPENPDFVELPSFDRDVLARGDCYIQDPSTAVACRMIEAQPGEKILDACAAPGGKTSYLAELMQNQGLIVACDRNPERISLLEENIERLGVTIVRAILCDWTREKIPNEISSLAPFDRILVDAPCGNTGVMRRRIDVRWRLKAGDFTRMPNEQMSILRAVVPLLKSGGALVYSTCSLEREENEIVVESLVRDFSNLTMTEQKSVLPFRDHFDGAFAAKLVRA